jgi:hypothetical protein
MTRTQLLWVLVVFFGASLVFAGVHRLTDGESNALVVGGQLAALAVVLLAVLLVVRWLR